MPHTHKLQDGRETGKEIIDPDNLSKHWHMLDGERTSNENFGPRHTHTIDGELTGPPIEPEGNKAMPEQREVKLHGGTVLSTKQIDTPEGRFGIVEGYIATWDVDRGDFFGLKDQFVRGAFLDSIADFIQRRRGVRFKDHHGRTVGVWKFDTLLEDDRGLFGRAEINLEVQQGNDVYVLIKQGALSDFSIGFTAQDFTIDDDLRTITKATIWEGSIVDEPRNPNAVVTDFKYKAVVPFQDLPIADREHEWDAEIALERVKEFTESDQAPSAIYRRAFIWFDKSNDNVFSGYKFQVSDIINGRLTVIPNAVFAAAAAVKENASIPDSDRPGVIRHLERYYAKMDLPSPFEDDEDGKQFLITDDVRDISARDLEKTLRDTGRFSRNAAKALASRIAKNEPVLELQAPELDNTLQPVDNQILKELIADLKALGEKR